MTHDQLCTSNVDCSMLWTNVDYNKICGIWQKVERLKYCVTISGSLTAIDAVEENDGCVWIVYDYTTWPEDLIEEYVNAVADKTKLFQSLEIYNSLQKHTTIKKLQNVTAEELQEILYKNEVFITNIKAQIKNQEIINELCTE